MSNFARVLAAVGQGERSTSRRKADGMKVLKFGGTSVGSVESMLNLREIVHTAAREGDVIVVVSALSGVTDCLIETARLASGGDGGWADKHRKICDRHHSMIDAIIASPKRGDLLRAIDGLLEELRSIYYGVYLIRDLSRKTLDTIESYGERLSSLIVATFVEGAGWKDSRQMIKTELAGGKHVLRTEETYRLVKDAFTPMPHLTVIPGFIARDGATGDPTTLGRGGSDYTASIVAAALDAEALEIWTDVDGFMTADPHIIKTAYTIKELSYMEAMELSNFGAKVIYPPTIYPVCIKNIPIRIKNTFSPSSPGTVVKREISNDGKPIKGISSIGGADLLTVTGLSMVGVIGINRRIFTALAESGISVFLVAQASSENSTSMGVRHVDSEAAVRVLNREFSAEIESGAMFPVRVETGMATIAIVGANMKSSPGIAGKLFGTLGRSGISVRTVAQGASETNISLAIREEFLRKALNVIHDSFFLSEQKVLNLFVCGVGTVGGMLLEQINAQYKDLKEHSRLKLKVVGVANSRHAVFDREGIDLRHYKERLAQGDRYSPEDMLREIIGMNIFNPVFVDCTASADVSKMYQPLLEHNVSVIAANKIAASSSYESYFRLKETALEKGVKYGFETNVAAGLPVIGTINDLRNSGDKILRIEAVLSGTLNYIFNELSAKVPFSETVRRAKEAGYSEPDPRIDLCGKDVVRKLVILMREAGCRVEQEDIETHLFVPDEYFEGSLEEFWQRLPELDKGFEERRRLLEAEGKHWRFVATMDGGKGSVGLQAVDAKHPFYNLEGSNNIILLTTERYHRYPMMIQGYGAGAEVTAAGVFANIISIANI